MKKTEFCGWYFKCQGPQGTVALIPARHGGAASVQLITDAGSWSVPVAEGPVDARRPRAALENSLFAPWGIRLALNGPGLRARGRVRFGPPAPPAYDVMGPLAAVPFLECRHRVASMCHTVTGTLWVNGRQLRFAGDRGYIEGDRGRSFPGGYLWVQGFFSGGSLMLAAAQVPLGPARFRGVIALVRLAGREWRLASYLGARVTALGGGRVTVRQGRLRLTVAVPAGGGKPLCAPENGAMGRTIRENAAAPAQFRLMRGGRVLAEGTLPAASFEWEYP